MKTIKELTEKMKQTKGSIMFNMGYCNSSLNLYNATRDSVYRFSSNKSFDNCSLQEIEADLMAQVNESEIVERLIYESRTK